MTYLLDYENSEKNFKLVKTTVTAYDTVGTSWANISGSQIAYTPASGASKVIYEFSSAYGYLDYDNSLDDTNKLRSSVGLGIDWFTPIGPLSISLAHPLTKVDTDRTETFKFNLGTTF